MSQSKQSQSLGSLSAKLISELTAASPKGSSAKCAACKNNIHGLIVQALEKTWHPEHFLCHHCKKPIKGTKFYKNKDKPYCEADYEMLFLKKCSGCDQPIRDVVVEVLNQFWHRDHFVCSTCGMNLSHKGFCERDNRAYCELCYETKFATKCKACDLPLTGLAIIALNHKWHQQCFMCKRCLKPITDSTFDVINDDAICDKCVQIISEPK